MLCPKCSTEMQTDQGRYHFRESGLDNVWLDSWPLLACPRGCVKLPVLCTAETMNRLVARQLLTTSHPLGSDSILFLREALRLTSEQLAALLRVHRVEVSRWENGHFTISPLYDLRLRLKAADCLFPDPEKQALKDNIIVVFECDYQLEKREPNAVTLVPLISARARATGNLREPMAPWESTPRARFAKSEIEEEDPA
jgi:DNA-binding transcriptional regulator YiaG